LTKVPSHKRKGGVDEKPSWRRKEETMRCILKKRKSLVDWRKRGKVQRVWIILKVGKNPQAKRHRKRNCVDG
jgi:hypothetical protein